MAALALNPVRASLSAFFNFPFLKATAPSTLWSSPSIFGHGSFPSFLEQFFPPWLLAVPKKKVSHSRKSMRSANKGLKDKQNIVHCPGCGSPKLAHHLCANCYGSVSKLWKSKGNGSDSIPDLS